MGSPPRPCLYMGMDASDAARPAFSTQVSRHGPADPDVRVAELYAAHYQRLVSLTSLLAGGHALGEEIAQETFLIALTNERRKPGYLTDPAWPWLRTTALRLSARLRSRLLREVLPSIMHRTTDMSSEWTDETIDVVRALSRLPPQMRRCVVLAHLEDQSTASIATLLSCSTKNVEHRLHEGRARLRGMLGDRYNTI